MPPVKQLSETRHQRNPSVGSPRAAALARSIGPIRLWGLAVGLVISGDYFGWNLGLSRGGPLGMVVATLAVTGLYLCFMPAYTELASSIPHAAGPAAFAERALGSTAAAIAGAATLVEFVFAPPAIARAIGAYVHFRVPAVSADAVAVGCFCVFGLVNALGVSLAASFELVVTALATLELAVFFVLTIPSVSVRMIAAPPMLPNGVGGVFFALPFAIWFYLGLEGAAMSAEEVVDPPRTIPRGFAAAIATLVVLALAVLVCATGVVPWRELVLDDSPLPRALSRVLSPTHPLTHMVVYLGLLGLIASFHGIILACSRQVFALARRGMLPFQFSSLHASRRTPIVAIVATCTIGIAATLTRRTDALITMAVLGALVVYIVSMLAALRLRIREPDLVRPYKAPMQPWLSRIAIAMSLVALASVAVGAPGIAVGFVTIIGVGTALFRARLRILSSRPDVGTAQSG